MTFSELNIEEKSGKIRYSTICPQCNSTRQKHKNAQCLTVNNEEGNRWLHCNHCGWSMNLDIADKFDKVAENSRMPKQVAQTYSQEVREYYAGRGISTKTLLKEKIFEFSRARKPIIGYPFYIALTLVNVKYFDVRWKAGQDSPKFWQMKREHGAKALFLGMQSIQWEEEKPKTVLITEGEVDFLTWKECGYNNTMSVPMGAPNPNAKEFTHEFAYANDKYVQSFFKDVDTIIFSTDNDKPGIVLRNQLALIFGKERCKYVNYPLGYKDINEVFWGDKKKELPALGQAGVDTCYKSLSSFPLAGIIRPSQVRDELLVLANEGFKPGLGIGIPEVDDLYTLNRKRIAFITGLPSAGKSVYVRWYNAQFVLHNSKEDIKFALFTPENRPVSREYAKLAEVFTGLRYQKGFKNSMTDELRNKTMRFIEKHFFIVSPDRLNFESFDGKITSNKVNTMESILKYLIYLKKTENIFGYVIDAWNKIEHEQSKNMTETSFISQQLDYLIDFNDQYDVNGQIIVHPTKIEKQGANYRMPNLYDIKGSSAWKEKADIGLIIHRYTSKRKRPEDIPSDADEDDKYYIDNSVPTIIKTEKIRFEEEGNMNRTRLKMDPYKGGRFYVYKAKDAKDAPPEQIKGALHPPKRKKTEEEEELQTVFDGTADKDELSDLPF